MAPMITRSARSTMCTEQIPPSLMSVALGPGAKPVAVPLSDLEFMRDADGKVHAVTSWTKDQLEKMPEHHH